jgi:hypothetical protein
MNDLISQNTTGQSGAMAIATSRQGADSQTQMIAAKRFPRDESAALARILKSCERKGLAEAAVYSYKKGDSVIEGASIRLAETIAQNWGNMNFGFAVLDSSETESQVMAFAWDLETNTQRQLTFPVSHLRVTKTSSWLLKDPREIYETVANAAARRVRACILAIIPGDIVDSALAVCDQTMHNVTGKALPERIIDMVQQFSDMGITAKQIELRLQTPRAAWTSQQVVAMGRLYLSLRDGFLKRDEVPEFVDSDTVPVQQSGRATQKAQAVESQTETKPEPVGDELPLPFTTQIEQATGSRQLDLIAKAVVSANLSEDETAFYKTMVTEARERLKGTK